MTHVEYEAVRAAEGSRTVQFLRDIGVPQDLAEVVAAEAWDVAFKYHEGIARERLVDWINSVASTRLQRLQRSRELNASERGPNELTD